VAHSNKSWKGEYQIGQTNHEMTIDHLNIFKNKVKGKGTDEVGEYTISGELKPDNTVTFVK